MTEEEAVDEFLALPMKERVSILLDACMEAGLDDLVWGEGAPLA